MNKDRGGVSGHEPGRAGLGDFLSVRRKTGLFLKKVALSAVTRGLVWCFWFDLLFF